jgi:hypothetical protein
VNSLAELAIDAHGVDSQRQQDELLAWVKFVSPTPTDEVLVAAAKLGDHPAFLELWTGTRIEYPRRRIRSRETAPMQKTQCRMRG